MLRNASSSVIGVCEKNPHYYQYKGKEILLITSAEMYGSLINKQFNYRKYFDLLHEYRLNYTRIYPGAMIERTGMSMDNNPLAPGPEAIVPWARSNVPGYIGGGNKFDLDKWDPEYFARLKDYVSYAGQKGIFVEICFYNAQYPESYEYSPLYKNSNIQGIGDCDHITFQYMDHDKRLFARQLDYIEKLIVETNEFDNVIYEFIDEPTLFLCNEQRVCKWISAHIDKAIEVEARLPKKHMLAQQLEFGVSYADDDRVAVTVTQYIEGLARQVGGLLALNNVYCFNKPIELNETAVLPGWFQRCDPVASSRSEAWEFMVGGGAAFNQLNGYFNVSNPEGKNETNYAILDGLDKLRTFMENLDYVNMTRDVSTIMGVSCHANINLISEKGKKYAMYMHHGSLNYGSIRRSHYIPGNGKFAPVITLDLQKGEYEVAFIEPKTLKVVEKRVITCDGGEFDLQCPEYEVDIAILVEATAKRA